MNQNDTILKNKVLNRITSIELVTSEKCQNHCSYCYRTYKHNSSSFYSMDGRRVFDLLNKFLWLFKLDKDYYNTKTIELFGGDGLLDYKKSIDIFRAIDTFKPKAITIPTNGRLVSELTELDLINLLSSSGDTRVFLSLSVDGNLGSKNRKLSKFGNMLSYKEQIDFDKLFNLSKKYHWGYHPMLPFEDANSWFSLIQFFYNNYRIVPYLLEIRHSLSKEESVDSVKALIEIRNFYEDKLKKSDSENREKILHQANTIKASTCPRGIGCSALTSIYIMPNGDLPFCHRVIDPPWVMGNVDQQILDVSKMVIFRSGYDHRNHPSCMVCPIRIPCNGQCQGACYEYWGDPFIPIESICNYYLLKYYVFSKLYIDWKRLLINVDISLLEKSVFNIFGRDTVNNMVEN